MSGCVFPHITSQFIRFAFQLVGRVSTCTHQFWAYAPLYASKLFLTTDQHRYTRITPSPSLGEIVVRGIIRQARFNLYPVVLGNAPLYASKRRDLSGRDCHGLLRKPRKDAVIIAHRARFCLCPVVLGTCTHQFWVNAPLNKRGGFGKPLDVLFGLSS